MYIVCGPGRSGTSKVAGYLCDLGVFMGATCEQDEANPEGYYEDTEFKNLHKLCMSNEMNIYEWYRRAKMLVDQRNKEHERWGFKDPRTCYFLQHYLTMDQNVKIIRVKRVRQDVVQSMMRCYGWTYQQAYQIMMERETLLDQCKTLNFQIEKNKLEEIKEWL